MKIQLWSDQHGEAYHRTDFIWNYVKPIADIAIVAGDIHSRYFEDQINEISTKFKHVVCVFGNHSFYKRDIEWRPNYKILNKNIHILDRGVWQYYNTVFIGATLWTDFKNQDFHVMHAAKDCINDFRVISANNGGTRFTPQMAYDLHVKDKAYIKMMIEKFRAEKKKIVVITHFMPSYQCVHEKWRQNPGTDTLNSYFSANCDDLVEMEGIDAWCFGHTHDKREMVIGSTPLYCNPLGYPRENPEFTDMVFNV